MKSRKYYTIYKNSTDEIVASGFLEECAKQFETNKRCMSSIISRALTGKRNKYSVVVENIQIEQQDNEQKYID